MCKVSCYGMIKPPILEETLSQIGVMRMIDDGKTKQAASLIYQWLLTEVPSPRRQESADSPNLYEMLSYLVDRSTEFGFTFETRIEKDGFVITVTNNKLQKSRVIPILLEFLLAHICEKLSNVESEIDHIGKDTIVKIRLR